MPRYPRISVDAVMPHSTPSPVFVSIYCSHSSCTPTYTSCLLIMFILLQHLIRLPHAPFPKHTSQSRRNRLIYPPTKHSGSAIPPFRYIIRSIEHFASPYTPVQVSARIKYRVLQFQYVPSNFHLYRNEKKRYLGPLALVLTLPLRNRRQETPPCTRHPANYVASPGAIRMAF